MENNNMVYVVRIIMSDDGDRDHWVDCDSAVFSTRDKAEAYICKAIAPLILESVFDEGMLSMKRDEFEKCFSIILLENDGRTIKMKPFVFSDLRNILRSIWKGKFRINYKLHARIVDHSYDN